MQNEHNEKKGWFNKLKLGLRKTHNSFINKISGVLKGKSVLDADLCEQLEEILILSDVGVQTSALIIDRLKNKAKGAQYDSEDKIQELIKEIIVDILQEAEGKIVLDNHSKPFIILVLGVNGVGKTTTIAKLAHFYKNEGKNILIAAADTFRAAAIEQLQIWGKRAGIDVISHQIGSDPSAVVFDSIKSAKENSSDLLIVDTAGRLHTKKNLMVELDKMKRIMGRECPEAPHEILLVLDATCGQNALQQAKQFKEIIGVTGIALAKLDGTAKGGIIISIAHELNIPVKFIGVGEGLDDLRTFESKLFVEALFEDKSETV
ncbi:MAG: signal recognition particle-docking protein FtsY [bacterium]